MTTPLRVQHRRRCDPLTSAWGSDRIINANRVRTWSEMETWCPAMPNTCARTVDYMAYILILKLRRVTSRGGKGINISSSQIDP